MMDLDVITVGRLFAGVSIVAFAAFTGLLGYMVGYGRGSQFGSRAAGRLAALEEERRSAALRTALRRYIADRQQYLRGLLQHPEGVSVEGLERMQGRQLELDLLVSVANDPDAAAPTLLTGDEEWTRVRAAEHWAGQYGRRPS